jgi:hypothetical protein
MTTVGEELDVCADTDVSITAPADGPATDPTPTDPKPADAKKLPKIEGNAGLAWLSDPLNLKTMFSDDLDAWMSGGDTLIGDRLNKLPYGAKQHASIARLSRLREKTATPVPMNCVATLKDRVVLATCSIEVAVPVPDAEKVAKAAKAAPGSTAFPQLTSLPITLSVSARYYNFGTVGLSDKPMTECLSMKGSWSAVGRDSREWARARLDHDSRKLRRAVENENQAQ